MRTQRMMSFLIGLVFIISSTCAPLSAQTRSERKQAAIEDSSKPTLISGGQMFQLPLPYEGAYDLVLNYLKRNDQTIDSANKETGQIITAISVSGGWRQTGTRQQIVLIKDDETNTTFKVAVTKQKRYKALQTEPWGDSEIDSDESMQLATQLKQALQPTAVTDSQ